jgi:tRNA nucleotidyltransferase (CCA-adding enzyme)
MLDDLRRRDFTANAMAISLNDGSYGLLLDPLNGIADVEARLLRLVSSYGFIEDPSRLLRAVRFQARTGWDLEERTKVRYQNAKESGAIDAISPYLAGYELEEIGHEEDGLKALKALESEGWMKHIFPAWASAKADVAGLEALHQVLIQFLIQGIHPDISAPQMELLTAKMAPKDLTALKKRFPRPGFVKYWGELDEAAKEFQKELLDKKNAAPSATWKLLTTYAPEPILWLAYTSKSSQAQTKFKNFFTVWPEARQKIPTPLMLEMRIVPEMPGYQELVQEIFYQLMDEKLQTEEEMRAFLEPHSPPAPPPPVKIGRSRKRGESRLKLREEEEETEAAEPSEDEEEMPITGRLLDEEAASSAGADLESDEEEEEEEEEAEVAPVPRGKAAKATATKSELAPEAKGVKPVSRKGTPEKKPVKTAEPVLAPRKSVSHAAPTEARAPKSAPAKPAKTPTSNQRKRLRKRRSLRPGRPGSLPLNRLRRQ